MNQEQEIVDAIMADLAKEEVRSIPPLPTKARSKTPTQGPLWRKSQRDADLLRRRTGLSSFPGAPWGRQPTRPSIISGKDTRSKRKISFGEVLKGMDKLTITRNSVVGKKSEQSTSVSSVMGDSEASVSTSKAANLPSKSPEEVPSFMPPAKRPRPNNDKQSVLGNPNEADQPNEELPTTATTGGYIILSPPVSTAIGVIQKILDVGLKKSGPWRTIVLCNGKPLELRAKKLKRLMKTARSLENP